MASEVPPPLQSAAGFSRGNYARAFFDDGLAAGIDLHAKARAPDDRTIHRHRAGVAAELAYSGYEDEPINHDIYDDYVGDAGYDLTITREGGEYLVEVKCVYLGEPELRVPRDQADQADFFVLARTREPTDMVELLGYVHQNVLNRVGETYPDDNLLRVPFGRLNPFEPLVITPDRIRDAQVVDL